MPIIEVSMLEGRTPAQKESLIAALTDAAEQALGVPREAVRVLLREVPPEHWGVGGVSKRPPSAAPRRQAKSR